MGKGMQRFIRTAAFTGLRVAFTVGEKLAPRRAARWASRLWFGVPSAPAEEKRDRGVQPHVSFEVPIGDHCVRAHSWGQGRPVLLLHGWSGWWQQMSVYIQPLVDAGFRPITWDAPSHGESEPGRYGEGRSGMPDLMDAVEAVAGKVGKPAGIVAHSGGAMAAALSVIDGLDTDKVVFVSPSVAVEDMMALMGRRLGWGPRTIDAMAADINAQYGLKFMDFDVMSRAEAADRELPPGLFIHDTGDEETPHDGSDRLARVWPGARVLKTTGLGHYKVLWDKSTVDQVVRFLSE